MSVSLRRRDRVGFPLNKELSEVKCVSTEWNYLRLEIVEVEISIDNPLSFESNFLFGTILKWFFQCIFASMKVKAIQDKNFRDRKLKKGVMALKKSKPVPDDVNFHCRKCNEAVCQAHDIRRVRETFYVIINSDVRESKVDALSLTAVKHM